METRFAGFTTREVSYRNRHKFSEHRFPAGDKRAKLDGMSQTSTILPTSTFHSHALAFLSLAAALGTSLSGNMNLRAEEPRPIPYLALGDSYTIGESVAEHLRWPEQLAAGLRADPISPLPLDAPVVIAKTGWTTDELDAAIDQASPNSDFDLVTLLFGVNNQYRQRTVDSYKPEFEKLLRRSIGFAAGRPERVVVVSIPDYGITPFVKSKFEDVGKEGTAERENKFHPDRIARELDAYNAAAKEITESLGARWVDITPVSRSRGTEKSMLADDGLHPSGEMYRLWAEQVMPVAKSALSAQ